MRNKLKISLIILLFISPFIINETLAYSVRYREVFFYADVVVSNHIIENGHITLALDRVLTDKSYVYWGKIATKRTQPFLPILITEYSMITTLPRYVFYSHFPFYLLNGFMYFLLARRFSSSKIALPIAFVGMAGPQRSPVISGARTLDEVFFLLIIWVILCLFQKSTNNQKSTYEMLGGLILPLLLVSLLLLYPRLFIEAAILVILSGIILYKLYGDAIIGGLSGLIMGLWMIVFIPFDVYIYYATGIVALISGHGDIFETSEISATPLNILNQPPYGLISVIPLLVLGIVGGVVTFWKLYIWTQKDENCPYNELVLFLWGITTIIFVVLHLFTGTDWLTSRYLSISLPLVIVAASLGMSNLFNQLSRNLLKRAVIVLVIATTLLSYALVGGSSLVDIHTYSAEETESAEWASSYSAGTVMSDMSKSALIVPSSTPSNYPDDPSSIKTVFYQTSKKAAINESQATLFMFNKEMITDGFYIRPSARKPASKRWYYLTSEHNNIVYSNSNTKIISI